MMYTFNFLLVPFKPLSQQKDGNIYQIQRYIRYKDISDTKIYQIQIMKIILFRILNKNDTFGLFKGV